MDTSPVRDTPSPVEMPELQVQRIIDRLRDVYRKNLAKSAAARAALAEYGFTDQSLIERYMGGFSDGTLPKLLPADKSLRGQLTQLGVLDDRAQERFANCVVFPVDSADGRRVTLWACPKEGPPRFLLTRPVPLWNAIAAKHSAHLYVFDGPITALSAAAAGLSNIAALDPDAGEPDHKAITGWGVQGISVIVPATPEGLKKGKQIQARLEPLKSTLVSIPGCDSLNALFRTQGPKGDPNTSGQDSGQNGATPVTWNYDQLPVDNSGAAQYQSLNVQGVNTAA
ncbi:MAG TPA: hypothetical protein VG892_09255, partial [Terriglobales bacterium]|nr:hypothetical protein [Terriglobales bacterium]